MKMRTAGIMNGHRAFTQARARAERARIKAEKAARKAAAVIQCGFHTRENFATNDLGHQCTRKAVFRMVAPKSGGVMNCCRQHAKKLARHGCLMVGPAVKS